MKKAKTGGERKGKLKGENPPSLLPLDGKGKTMIIKHYHHHLVNTIYDQVHDLNQHLNNNDH